MGDLKSGFKICVSQSKIGLYFKIRELSFNFISRGSPHSKRLGSIESPMLQKVDS